ncbi:hypothetical protein LSH36_65g03007 [Paralvinella palmiformis]|uniref:Uncharacterized protein n=1 Tax=Paralvinella palmiformis TaxID=53620 RepID=A0AAD9K410_9ANNE|nr:hypothetical protein LSH36_65g03007 [Paralvinella palmiformis]
MMCRPSPVQTTGSLALECGPFVRSVNLEMPQTGPIPDPTRGMITDNPVEPTDTISTTDNTSHHVTLPQVPTTENDTMTPRPPRELGPLNISAAQNTQIQIDSITEAMVEAAKLASCIPKKQYSPKKYWCPELSRLRDSKRFWWHLWVTSPGYISGLHLRVTSPGYISGLVMADHKPVRYSSAGRE